MNGMGFSPCDDGVGDILERPYHLRAAVFHEFARHAPDDRGRFRLGDGAAAALRSRFIASAPSCPIPVIITPIIWGASKCSSALATMRSTLGCHK